MIKKYVGIGLIIFSILCLAFGVMGIYENIAHSGPWAGAITTYRPPFYAHGLLVIIAGIVGVFSFLAGLYLVAQSRL